MKFFIFQNFDFLVRKKSENVFDMFFTKKFWSRNNIFWKKFLPMSTQKFLRIPKIVLRKPCDEPKHAKTSTLVFFVYLKHRKYPPSDHRRTSPDPGYSGGIRSYGALFSQNARQNLNWSPRWSFRLTSGFLWWIDT